MISFHHKFVEVFKHAILNQVFFWCLGGGGGLRVSYYFDLIRASVQLYGCFSFGLK